MNLLQIFFIISGLIIFILALDISRKQKFNALHFFVFLFVWGGLLVFTFFPSFLDALWKIFGLQRGADLLVYASIIFIFYFILLLLRKTEENISDMTELVRELALNNANIKNIKGKEVFIIPSHNEAQVLDTTIRSIYKAWYKHVIIVDDGSTDGTDYVLEKYRKKVVVLKHMKNRGQWASLETWFEYVRRYADVDYVVTFDADGQHDIDDLKTFEKYLELHPEVDILLWSRFLWNGEHGIPLLRKGILKLGIVFTYFLSQIKLSDTHNGFRVIKKSFIYDLKITIDGMWHASEILDIVASKKIQFREVPVTIKYTDYSLMKWQSSGNAFKIALRFIWNKFFK